MKPGQPSKLARSVFEEELLRQWQCLSISP